MHETQLPVRVDRRVPIVAPEEGRMERAGRLDVGVGEEGQGEGVGVLDVEVGHGDGRQRTCQRHAQALPMWLLLLLWSG